MSADRTAKIWDTQSGALVHTLGGHTDTVYAVSFSRDGKLIATSSWDNTARVWDAATGAALHTLKGHTPRYRVYSLSLQPGRHAAGDWESRQHGQGLGRLTTEKIIFDLRRPRTGSTRRSLAPTALTS